MGRVFRQVSAALLLVWLDGAALLAQEPSLPRPTPEEQQLAAEAAKLFHDGVQLYRQGNVAAALPRMEQSLELQRRLYPASHYPDGHPELASGLANVGFMLKAAGSAQKALPYCEQSLAMWRKLYPEARYPDGHPDLATSLNNVASVLQAARSTDAALPFYEQALTMRRKLYPESKYPDGHPDLATSLNNMGYVLKAAGEVDRALPFYEQALAMRRKLYPEQKYPNGHSELALSLHNMGSLLDAAGSAEKALPFFDQALAMNRWLYPVSRYPNGHPELARTLNSMGMVLQGTRSLDRALPYCEEALSMYRTLYPASRFPGGHPDLAQSLTNMGIVLWATRSADRALPFCEEALAMQRTLYPEAQYPNGHPHLAQSLTNVGVVLWATGAADRALPFYEQALAMRRRLYPEAHFPGGHPELARSLDNMGAVLREAGLPEKALPFCEQALAMKRTLGQRLLLTSAEADALAYVEAQPLTCDSFLSVTLRLPRSEAAAYDAVWHSKAAITRVLELRHAAARARAGGDAPAERLTRLKDLRRRTEQLLQDTRRQPDERDRELARLTDERDALERQLAKDLPVLALWTERDKRTPADLARALPAGTAFVDLLAWARFEDDPNRKGKGEEKQVPSYLAFVVAPGKDVRRIDLGPAEPIDCAVRSWRQALERQETSSAPDQLATLVWDKIVKQLPPGTMTLYLSPDGDLARVPWAALPIGRGRVLLEDFALATVPHGPFLLEHLAHPPKYAGPELLLTLGDVSYHSATWPELPGTRNEIDALAALAPTVHVALTKGDATAAKLSETLPKARYAHLATHGEFQAEAFAAERQRQLAARRSWQEGHTQEARRVAARNPLGYVGLVLSGGERLSGLSILDLDLANVKLVTLSACETGLGEYTGGKGVENLQEAFHLAGCANVVASLWKVNDAATAALMAQFYHELWVNRREPLAALRESQLTLYWHPERIPELAGERGRPALEAAAKLGSATGAKPDEKPKTAPTKLWAAFVLSGVGK
jgi:CHAT domain-containing protein/tetratricopeptide (TPR) repeat protein